MLKGKEATENCSSEDKESHTLTKPALCVANERCCGPDSDVGQRQLAVRFHAVFVLFFSM